MGRLKILASGITPQAKANARGKLFERLMAEVLRHNGYSIDRIPSVNYSGMEIDIEGKAIATGINLYAECKCYESEIDSPKLQAFFGNYMTFWHRDKRCQALFIALPGVNSYAKGFYRDNCENSKEFTVRLLEEEQVLEAIYQTMSVTRPDSISRSIEKEMGTPGDWVLLYTDKGVFWVQYVVPPGSGIPTSFVILNATGNLITDTTTTDYLKQLYPELHDFEQISFPEVSVVQQIKMQQEVEEIVEVRGSSECFEYQFPASPEYFVGRQYVLEEIDSFVTLVLNKKTSCRGILFEANSGWGKSSVVLASVERLKNMGHFAVAVDSRSASSSQFILRAVSYALTKFGDFNGQLFDRDKRATISGFDSGVKALLEVGNKLESDRKVMFIFFDQFENVFFLLETLKRITDLLLKLCDAQTNVVLGFSWKTDLVGLTSEFPYQLRDSIVGSSRRIFLETFSEIETIALLEKLSEELQAPLRKDLMFFLSDFSQGYPWLLKKLCAHVKTQRESGTSQLQIANSLLNIKELFQEDLRGLSSEEEETLRRIAKTAPISASELGEEMKFEVVQNLVYRRLIMKIGHKFDVYWDIFRDYLNSGRVPVQENYILRVNIGSVLKAIKLLAESNGELDASKFQKKANLTEKSFYNVVHDTKLLGLAKLDNGKVILQNKLSKGGNEFEDALRTYLRERLPRNRLVWRILKELDTIDSLSLDQMGDLLLKTCPYISATIKSWQTYARNLADWMDIADLSIFDNKKKILSRFMPGAEIREPRLILAKRRGGIVIPRVQYTPVLKVATKIIKALKGDGKVDWTDLKKSTISKSLATLEDLGFIIRKPRSITVLPKAIECLATSEKSSEYFAEGVLKIEAFNKFIEIIEVYKNIGCTLSQLAIEVKKKLDVDWGDSTAKTNVKIMLDWARHTNLAPGVFAKINRGRRWDKRKNNKQILLF